MKAGFFFLFLFIGFGLSAQVNDSNKHAKNTQFVNRIQINILDGKPISFFLSHKSIDKNAKKFYRGEKGFNEDRVVLAIMDSLTACDFEVRPFYFFVFNQIVDLSNDRQADLVALKCKEFVELYPCEFFHSFNQPELNINVVKWTTYIGMNLKDRNSYYEFRNKVDIKVKSSCVDVLDLLKSFMSEVRMCLLR